MRKASSIVSIYLSNNSRVPPGIASRDLKTPGSKFIAEAILYSVSDLLSILVYSCLYVWFILNVFENLCICLASRWVQFVAM